MPELKRPLKVFLSYASQDKPLVRELSRRLVGEGWIDTWQDEKNLLPGQDWRVKIEEAVEDADVVIICLSNHSVTKEGHVQKELRYAREIALEKPDEAIFLIPLRLDECEVPRGLRFYQWVDYFEEKKDSSYKALVASLKLRYEQKLKAEKEEKLHREKQEREAAEKFAREKAEKEAAEKARLKAEEEERQRVAKEKELREKQDRESREKEKRETEKKEEKLADVKPKAGGQIAYWFGGFIVIVLGIILLSSMSNLPSTPQPTPENTKMQVIVTLSQNSVESSATQTPESTSTPSATQTPTSLPTEIVDDKGITMRLVPAGEFKMGSENGETDEKPVHQVYLDAYYMDIYEVTNIAYSACVTDGDCYRPAYNSSFSQMNYYGYLEFKNHPVVYVDWTQASLFCSWRGASLPTEAQWEKAARGTDERIYPWGNEIDCSKANVFDGTDGCSRTDTTRVGSFEDGKSPYGIYDLAGNVWEWVADWYSETYYQNSPLINPLGPGLPGSAEFGILRGGAWNNNAIRSSNRLTYPHHTSQWNFGFRCVKNIAP